MLDSKQRAALRGLAQSEEPILHIGKDGVTDNIIKQAAQALSARELGKGTVQQNSSVSAREACDSVCAATGADPVSVIGRKFVFYRRAEDEKHRKINI